MNNPQLEEIGIQFMDMNPRIDEQVFLNDDGSYTIFINSRLNFERQMAAYYHAINHIVNDDFGKECADDIENAM